MPSDYSRPVNLIISNSCIEISHYYQTVCSMYSLHHFSQGFVEALFCFSRSCFRWRIELNERCWYTLGVESQPHNSVTDRPLSCNALCKPVFRLLPDFTRLTSLSPHTASLYYCSVSTTSSARPSVVFPIDVTLTQLILSVSRGETTPHGTGPSCLWFLFVGS